MNPTLEIIVAYLLRVAPGLALAALLLLLLRNQPRLRIVLYLTLFVLLRDAMTPLGLWSFGTEGFFWIRLHTDPWFLIAFGVSCLMMSLLAYYVDRANQPLFHWRRGRLRVGTLWGLGGAFLVVAPFVVLYRFTPIECRGGPVPVHNLVALLVFAFLGNLLEEAIFRGYVLGYFAQQLPLLQAGLVSGVVFAFCHVFLALTVTGLGYPLLVFTLWEGLIAGVVGARGGVLPATVTHGGAIFLLTSGLF